MFGNLLAGLTAHIAGLAIVAAIVCLFVSDTLYRSVVAGARPLLPENLRTEAQASFSLGAIMWQPAFPVALRRRYLLSILFALIAGFCVVLFLLRLGHPLWAAFFSLVILLVTGIAASGMNKYWSRR